MSIQHVVGDVQYTILGFNSKKKTLLTVADCGVLTHTKGLKASFYKWLWFTAPLKKASATVTISQASHDELIKYFPWAKNKIKVIHVPLSPEFEHIPKEFNSEKPVLLQVGTGKRTFHQKQVRHYSLSGSRG